ncbi:CHAT domain-containing protein [Stieleria varia]|uniref:CHAT domain protein n=1 Tax=Stieleria varia TaxID=2528005 RepID=A0A5C5ZNT4_9BACT|nr:CHAT domain-containing protein [Stieleria varia]TWT89162.1 CHAT domain protein [Stieleria varia]
MPNSTRSLGIVICLFLFVGVQHAESNEPKFGFFGIQIEGTSSGVRVKGVTDPALVAGSPLQPQDLLVEIEATNDSETAFYELRLENASGLLAGPITEIANVRVMRDGSMLDLAVPRLAVPDSSAAMVFLAALVAFNPNAPEAPVVSERFKESIRDLRHQVVTQIFDNQRARLSRMPGSLSACVACCVLEKDELGRRFGVESPEWHGAKQSEEFFRSLEQLVSNSPEIVSQILEARAGVTADLRASNWPSCIRHAETAIKLIEDNLSQGTELALGVLEYQKAVALYSSNEMDRSETSCLAALKHLDAVPSEVTRYHVDAYDLLAIISQVRGDFDANAKMLGFAHDAMGKLGSTSEIDVLKLRLRKANAIARVAQTNRDGNLVALAMAEMRATFDAATDGSLLDRKWSAAEMRNLSGVISETTTFLTRNSYDPLLTFQVSSTAIAALQGLGADPLLLSNLYLGRGNIRAKNGDPKNAIPDYRKAIDLLPESSDPSGVRTARIQYSLVEARYQAEPPSDDLLRELQAVLATFNDGSGDKQGDIVKIMSLTGLVASRLGKADLAIQYFDKVIASFDNVPSLQHARELHNYADALSRIGRHDQACEKFESALIMMRRDLKLDLLEVESLRTATALLVHQMLYGDRWGAQRQAIRLMFNVLQKLGRLPMNELHPTIDLLRPELNDLFQVPIGLPAKNTSDRRISWSSADEAVDQALKEDVYQSILGYRKLIFDQQSFSARLAARNEMESEYEEKIRKLVGELAKTAEGTAEQLEILAAVAKQQRIHEQSIRGIMEEFQMLVELPSAELGPTAAPAESEGPLDLIQRSLKPNQILVDYFSVNNVFSQFSARPSNISKEHWDQRSFVDLWVAIITSNAVEIMRLGDRSLLTQYLARHKLEETPFRQGHPGQQLSELLAIDRLVKSLDLQKKGKQTAVVFSGDMAIPLIPFAALPVSNDRYLIEAVQSVEFHPSPLNYFGGQRDGGEIGVSNDLLLTVVSQKNSPAGAAAEENAIAGLTKQNAPVFSRVVRLKGNDPRLDEESVNATVILAASHGVSPVLSDLPGGKNRLREISIVPAELFVGMSDMVDIEAGTGPFLSVNRLQRQRMDKCYFAVFSGCRTALGELNLFSPVRSLQMAAIHAGARSSIGTISDVYDNSSQVMVTRMFELMFQAESKVTPCIALAEAQREMISNYRFDPEIMSLVKRGAGRSGSVMEDPQQKVTAAVPFGEKLPPIHWATYMITQQSNQ